MARDYKHRANQRKNKKPAPAGKVAWWKWLIVVVLIALFVFFLIFLGNTSQPTTQTSKKTLISKIKKKTKPAPQQQVKTPVEPRFDFYTILPETEIVVPDYEIDTRSREEKFGKGKSTKYLIQAGSFRNFAEADKLRARLALMGIESRVEVAKIGNATWNRVKMGPYSRSSSVSTIKKRLKSNGIDVVVTEIKS